MRSVNDLRDEMRAVARGEHQAPPLPCDLGPGVTGAVGSETLPALPLSLAERKAAAIAMLDALEAEERAAEPHPLALAVRRTDTFTQGLDQLTGAPRWVTRR